MGMFSNWLEALAFGAVVTLFNGIVISWLINLNTGQRKKA